MLLIFGFHTVSGISGIWILSSGIRSPLSMPHVAGFSTAFDFPTNFGGPAAVDISAAVIPYVNGVPTVVGLPACCCWLQYFWKHSCFCWRPSTVLAFLLMLSFLLLVVACVTAVACISAVAGIPDVAEVPLAFDVLTVVGLPAIAAVPSVVGVPAIAFLLAIAFLPAVAGVPAVAAILAVAYYTIGLSVYGYPTFNNFCSWNIEYRTGEFDKIVG